MISLFLNKIYYIDTGGSSNMILFNKHSNITTMKLNIKKPKKKKNV